MAKVDDQHVDLWDLGKHPRDEIELPKPVAVLARASRANRLIAVSEDPRGTFYDVDLGQRAFQAIGEAGGVVEHSALAPNGERFAWSTYGSNHVSWLDTRTRQTQTLEVKAPSSIVFSSDSTEMAIGGEEGIDLVRFDGSPPQHLAARGASTVIALANDHAWVSAPGTPADGWTSGAGKGRRWSRRTSSPTVARRLGLTSDGAHIFNGSLQGSLDVGHRDVEGDPRGGVRASARRLGSDPDGKRLVFDDREGSGGHRHEWRPSARRDPAERPRELAPPVGRLRARGHLQRGWGGGSRRHRVGGDVALEGPARIF